MEKTVLVFKKEGREVVNAEGPSLPLSLPFVALTRARLESDFDGKSFRLSAPFYASLDLDPELDQVMCVEEKDGMLTGG